MSEEIIFTDNDILNELTAQEESKKFITEAKKRATEKALEEKKKPKRQKRFELEQRFLGSIIREANSGTDTKKLVAKISAEYGINWRRFIDKRHRAIWRSLEMMDMLDVIDRREIIEKEAYADAKLTFNPQSDEPGADPVRGQPGSAADKQFEKKLEIESTKAIIWFERELEKADAFRLVGGKVYLREIAAIGDREFCYYRQLAMAMNEK